MKKKLLSVLAVAAVSAVALVGCGGDEHTHEYKWKYEGDKHWQECACGEKTKPVDHEDKKINATGEAGEDELCDFCGANLHKHVYEAWKSSAAGHWQECACGDKKGEEVAHEDKKNNETGAEGADEKCDVCGRGYYAVTFNMDGHGTAPATQYIGADGYAKAPEETPADDDAYKFKGWYKDVEHKTAFDFVADKITSATEIYAWFEEDKTPGASKKYAYALVLDESNPQKAKKGEAVYYSYKAAEDGRYTISLPTGTNSANATFTTNLTGETQYGKDCAADEITVDIDKNQSLYILYTFTGEVGDDVVVSPIVTNVDDEPLPKDLFKDGEYSDGVHTVEFTNEGKKILYDGKEYIAKYIGGKYKSLYFVKIVTLESGKVVNETFSLAAGANGKYTFSVKSDGQSANYAVEYVVPQPPVALSKILGYYEPVNAPDTGDEPDEPGTITPKPDNNDKDTSDAKGGIVGLYLYDTDKTNAVTVRYKTKTVNNGITITYSDLIDATYNTEKNRLIINETYTATLKLKADNSVEGLLINGVTYVRKGDAGAVPPAKLDLVDNTEYKGATHTIRTQYGSQYFGATGNDGITVLGYDEKTGTYTVDVIAGSKSVIYKMTVSQDKKTITFSDEAGKKHTLTMFEWNINNLPTVEATDNVTANGFQKGLRLYKVAETGWYSFNVPAGAEAWRNLNPNDYTDDEYVVKMANDAPVKLQKDEIIAVYMATPAAVAVKVARPEIPVGTTEENPKALENGTATLDVSSAQTYYFTYTAPAAGTYLVGVISDGYNKYVAYTVNGTQYGYGGVIDGWLGGVSSDNPYATIAADADSLEFDIRVECEAGWQNVTVTVSESYAEGATALALTGTPENDSLTVTATAATGANYFLASTKGNAVTVTGSAAFTVKVQGGAIITAEQSGEAYTATIPAGKGVYFRLASDTQQNLTLSQTFAKGTEGYPNQVTITDNAGSVTVPKAVEGDEGIAPVYGYYSLPAGTYAITANLEDDYAYVTLYLNGTVVNATDYNKLNNIVTINDGDVLCIEHTDTEADLSVSITKLNFIFTADQAGTYIGEFDDFGTMSKLILSFDRTGTGKIKMGAMDPIDVVITEIQNGYSMLYDGGSATFTLTNGKLSLIDETLADDPIVMEKEVGTVDNPKVVKFVAGKATVEVPLSDPDSDDEPVEYYLQLPEGTYSIVDGFNGLDYILKIYADGVEVDTLSVNPANSTYYVLVYEGDLLVVINYSGNKEITITEETA